ncbi:hypothetical protein GE061_001360 [Apolygus lucorum]|uniref:28S ribosomal protein S36, mitochondrial n=1 Tax=Apolygus lucorum TaxID=248454 RepID=A0A6A4J1S2_APOLU|nr:hypothetical protein GE061_001360 [Apolygus lucorum]
MKITQLLRSVEAAKSRIPSIKFRGGLQGQHNQGRPGGSQSGGSKQSSGSGQIYEDFQLPRRFKRQLIDEREIDAINSGGAY